jgi:hypothetical protein
MSASEGLTSKRSARLPMPSENVLLAVIAVGFLALHVLVAVTLMPASAKGPPMTAQEEVLSRLCD